jgi:hypothetical protein
MDIHQKYWTDADRKAFIEAKSFKDLAALTVAMLERRPHSFHMVSGPISTGGVGTRSGNQHVFAAVIERISARDGLPVFSQIPFEDKILELKNAWFEKNPGESYCMPVLLDFYEPIFKSGKIAALHFIHGYESSRGAVWEHDGCDEWKIERRYLSPELSVDLYNAVLNKK